MALTYQSGSVPAAADASGGSISVAPPASLASGDWWIITVDVDTNAAGTEVINLPSGWTSIITTQIVDSTTDKYPAFRAFYKVAGASESNVTITFSSGSFFDARYANIRISGAGSIDGTPQVATPTGDQTDYNAPDCTVTNNGSLGFTFLFAQNTTITAYPSGTTGIGTGASTFPTIAAAYQTQNSGTWSPGTWTNGADKIGALSFVVAPAAAGGAISGSSANVFGAGSSTLTGTGALAGTAAITITPTATSGAAGSITGSCALVFGAGSSTLRGTGALAGSAANVFGAGSSTLLGSGALFSSGGSVTFQWTAAAGATGYKIGYDTNSGDPYATVTDVGNVTEYTITGLTPGTWYVNVRSYDGGGDSAWNGEQVIQINDPISITPTGTLTNNTAGQISGTAAILFGAGSSTLVGTGTLTGSCALIFGAGSSIARGTGTLAGSGALIFGGSAVYAGYTPPSSPDVRLWMRRWGRMTIN